MAIKGPAIVVEDDNITIECVASKYKYQSNIKWIHRALNNKEIPINLDDSK